MEAVRSRYLDLDGPVHVADLGGEGPPIVCVHGLGGSYANWVGAARHLGHLGRISAIDLPGFGLTPPVGRPATVEANRSVLHRYLESLDGPVTLVGNSMGAAIALREAARSPETVQRLVLVSPAAPWAFHRVRWDPVVLFFFLAYGVPGLATLMLWGRHRLPADRVARWLLGILAARPERIEPELVELHVHLAEQRKHIPDIDRAFIRASRSVVWTAVDRSRYDRDVMAVKAPTLVLHGLDDRLVHPDAARRLASLRPDWEVHLLEEIGHVAMLEDPVLFGKMVESFAASSAVA